MTQEPPDEYNDELVGFLQLLWGEGFLAPGGVSSVHRTVAGVDLEGKKVLDIGCGVGGAAITLSRLGARMTGLDVETGLIERAKMLGERAGQEIEFLCVTPGPLPFEDGSFDHVFTHAAIIHVADKAALFSEIFRVLRPGGRLLGYDWLGGTEPFSDDMFRWLELEELTYSLDHLASYLATIEGAGFVEVSGEDDNENYRQVAIAEHARLAGEHFETMTEMLGPERRDHFIEDWRMLTVVLSNGELRPTYFRGRRP